MKSARVGQALEVGGVVAAMILAALVNL